MTSDGILKMLKANLEKVNTVNDDYLAQLIEVAKKEIAQEGISLTDNEGDYEIEDADLIVMYAAYLYRQRAIGNSRNTYMTTALLPQGMPYMLRLKLNNRLFSQKMRESS